ncbi:MAG TPA: hypothetical protein VFK44_00650 [Bacillales bacterium]|nr:hypothetical protein [Bacillales bacterium]
MIIMYPELEQFHRIEKEYNDKIAALEEELKQLHEDKAEASRQYNKALSKVVYERDSDSAVELAERKKASDALNEEMKETQGKIEQLRNSRDERLQNMVASLKEGRDREFDAALKNIESKKEELRRFRAEYLLLIQQLHQTRKYAQDVDAAFKKTVKPLTTEFEHESRTLPHVNLHNPFAEDEPHGVLEKDADQVYKTGKVPDWIESYSND